MTRSRPPTRRRVLAGSLGASAAALALGIRPAYAREITAGFIYVGPKNDDGYNQAHAEAAAAIKSMPGISVSEQERVPESGAVERAMQSMIELDGAQLLFPTSFGYIGMAMCLAASSPAATSAPPGCKACPLAS